MTSKYSQPQEMKILKLMQVESQMATITRDVEKLMSISAQHGSKIKELIVGMANSVTQVEFMAAITTQRYQSLNIAKQMEQSKVAEAAAITSIVDSSATFAAVPLIDPRNSSSHSDSGEVDKLKVKVSSLETELFDMSFKAEMERKRLENEVKATRTENQELKNSLKVLEDKFEQFVEIMQQKANNNSFQYVSPEVDHIDATHSRKMENKPAILTNVESFEVNTVQPEVENNNLENTKVLFAARVSLHPVQKSETIDNKTHVVSQLSEPVHLSPIVPVVFHLHEPDENQDCHVKDISLHHENNKHGNIIRSENQLHQQQQAKKSPAQQIGNTAPSQEQTKLSIPANITIPESIVTSKKLTVSKPVQIFDDELESGDDLTPMTTRPSSSQRKPYLKHFMNSINNPFSGQISPVITQQQSLILTQEIKQELLRDIIKGIESMGQVRTLAKQMSTSSVDAVVSHYTRQAIYEAVERGEDVTEKLRLTRSESEQLSGGLQELQDKYTNLQEETERLVETLRHQTEELALQNNTIEALQSTVNSIAQKLNHNQQRNRRASSLLINNAPVQQINNNHYHHHHNLNQQQKQNNSIVSNNVENSTVIVNRKNSVLLSSRKSSKVNSIQDSSNSNNVDQTGLSNTVVYHANAIENDKTNKIDNNNNDTNTNSNSISSTTDSAKRQQTGSFIAKDSPISNREVVAAAEATAQAFLPTSKRNTLVSFTKSIDNSSNLVRTSQLSQPPTVKEIQNEEEDDENKDKEQETNQNTKQNAINNNKDNNNNNSQNTQRVPLRTSILSLTPTEDLFNNTTNAVTSNSSKNNSAQLQALLQLQQKQNGQNKNDNNSGDIVTPNVRRSSKLANNYSRKSVGFNNNTTKEKDASINANNVDTVDNQKQMLSPPDSPMVRLYSAFDPTADNTLPFADADDTDNNNSSNRANNVNFMTNNSSNHFNSWLENETEDGYAGSVNESQDNSLMSVSLFEAPSEIDPLDANTLFKPLESPVASIASNNINTKNDNKNDKNDIKSIKTNNTNYNKTNNNNNYYNYSNDKDAMTRHLQSLIEALNVRLSAIDDHHLLQTSQLNALKLSSAQHHDAIVHCQTLIQTQQHAQQRLHDRVARVERVDRDQYFRPLLTSLEAFQQAQEEQEMKLTQVAEKMSGVTVEWQSWQHNQALWMTQNQPQSPSSLHPRSHTPSLLYSRGHTGQSNTSCNINQNIPPVSDQPQKYRHSQTLSLTIDNLLQQGGVGVQKDETVDASISKLPTAGNNVNNYMNNTRASLSLESDAGWDTSETPPAPNTTVVFSDEHDDFLDNTGNNNDNDKNNVLDNIHVMEIKRQVRFFNNILADLSSRHDALLTQHEALLETVRRGTVLRSRTGRGNSSQSDRVVSVPHVSQNIHPSATHHNVAEVLSNPLHCIRSNKDNKENTSETQDATGQCHVSLPRDVSPSRDSNNNNTNNNNNNNNNNNIIQNNVQQISQLNQDISHNVHFQQLQKDILSLRYAVTQAVHLLETHETRLVTQETQQQLQQTQLAQALKPKPFFVSPKTRVPFSSTDTAIDSDNNDNHVRYSNNNKKDVTVSFSVNQVPSLMNGRHLVRGREPHIDHFTAKELVDLKLLAESRISRENNAVPRSPVPPLFNNNTASLSQNHHNSVSIPLDLGVSNQNMNNVTNNQLSRHQRLLLQMQQSNNSNNINNNKMGRYPVSQKHPTTQQQPLVSQTHSWVSHSVQQQSLSTLSHSTSLSNSNDVHHTINNNNVDGKSIWYKDFGEDYCTLEKYHHNLDNYETADHLFSFGSDMPSSEDPDHLGLFPQAQSITFQPKSSDNNNISHDNNSNNNTSNNMSISIKMKRSLAKSQINNNNSNNDSTNNTKNKTSKSNSSDTPASIMARFHPCSVDNGEAAD